MFRGHGKLILVMLAGLVLGGAAGYGRKGLRSTRTPVAEVVLEFDLASFAKAGDTEAGAALARQLPAADAEKCAALAKAMLAKRVIVITPTDPFSDVPSGEMREEYLPERAWEGLFKRWMKVAPQAAWEFVLTNHSEELPLREAALRQWAMIDPSSAVNAAGEEILDDEKRVLLKACAESNPGIGLNLIAEWGLEFHEDEPSEDPFAPVSSSLVEKMLMNLAERSPVAAMEWCLAHAPFKVDAVCVGWMRHDSSACMEWLQALPVDEQKDLMSTICEQADVTASSVRYLANLCDHGNQLPWIDKGLYLLAKRDDALAQTLIDELLTNPTERLVLRSKIASSFAESDPRKAMDFILPALRTALPLFDNTKDIYRDAQLPSSVGISDNPFSDPFASDNILITDVIGAYISLGVAAGVGKAEVLDVLNQIHPQYYACILEDQFYEINAILGPSVEWLQPYTEKMSREQIDDLADGLSFSTPEEAQRAVLALKPGLLRDEIAERYVDTLLDNDVPIATVLESAHALKVEGLDLGNVYHHWMIIDPASALKHIVENPNPTANEWENVIRSGYKKNGAEIQDLMEGFPPGELRNAAVRTLSETAIAETSDYVTSMYWATEISARTERAKRMRIVLESWLADEGALRDASTIEGIRSNIENSSLDAGEKSLWLERVESEMTR